ncbi:hypothetical protein NDU88_004958 [Pleurodeles waltl]|uniref:Uncharacterized protein n=1 Tax=Pleurodeles waltl TaxID=8319 RepID=A0AAV7NNU2_PLEWA|nr:hypothetical protein NDU88_004958 [Pleurodeles waltl]
MARRTGGRGRALRALLACAVLEGASSLAALPSAWGGYAGGRIGGQFGPWFPPLFPWPLLGSWRGAGRRAAWLWRGAGRVGGRSAVGSDRGTLALGFPGLSAWCLPCCWPASRSEGHSERRGLQTFGAGAAGDFWAWRPGGVAGCAGHWRCDDSLLWMVAGPPVQWGLWRGLLCGLDVEADGLVADRRWWWIVADACAGGAEEGPAACCG